MYSNQFLSVVVYTIVVALLLSCYLHGCHHLGFELLFTWLLWHWFPGQPVGGGETGEDVRGSADAAVTDSERIPAAGDARQ